MFVQEIHIKRVDWRVRIYHAVDVMWADEILTDLIHIGCRGDKLKSAEKSLWSGLPNSGITYSNLDKRETIMVIGFTSNGEEYWNSLDHEKNHLLQDIALACNIDPYGEEISYISGEFIRDVYSSAKHLLCDCCRRKSVYRIS